MARYIDIEKAEYPYMSMSMWGINSKACKAYNEGVKATEDMITALPAADVVEKDKIAEMLRLMFDDYCACNYNGNDEWLPMKCKYAETDCPAPEERLGCWKEFVEYFLAKMDGGKTE